MQSPLNTDQQILSALGASDRNVTTELYRRHFPIVKGWMIKNGGTEVESADIFQEALVILFGKAQNEDFRLTCSIGTYLFAICKHIWYKELQKQSKEPGVLWEDFGNLEVSGLENDLEVHKEREEHYEQLDVALDQIGEPCRSILQAYYHENKNMQEIAADFGYTNAENAKNQKYKCLSRLKKIFFGMKTN